MKKMIRAAAVHVFDLNLNHAPIITRRYLAYCAIVPTFVQRFVGYTPEPFRTTYR